MSRYMRPRFPLFSLSFSARGFFLLVTLLTSACPGGDIRYISPSPPAPPEVFPQENVDGERQVPQNGHLLLWQAFWLSEVTAELDGEKVALAATELPLLYVNFRSVDLSALPIDQAIDVQIVQINDGQTQTTDVRVRRTATADDSAPTFAINVTEDFRRDELGEMEPDGWVGERFICDWNLEFQLNNIQDDFALGVAELFEVTGDDEVLLQSRMPQTETRFLLHFGNMQGENIPVAEQCYRVRVSDLADNVATSETFCFTAEGAGDC